MTATSTSLSSRTPSWTSWAAKKFSVLQEVRDIQNHEGVVATLSIGIGRDGETLAESYKYAGLAIDMALSRGGDQAVIKNRYSFEFFYGLLRRSKKRTCRSEPRNRQ